MISYAGWYEFLKQAISGLGHDAICAELKDRREMLAHAGPG